MATAICNNLLTKKIKSMNYEFETTIEEAEVTISFDYQPEEAMVMYYSDGSGYPGCAASIENCGVYWSKRKYNSIKEKWEDVEIDVTDLIDELGFDVKEMCFNFLAEQ